ncbi:hypothetical protein DSD19_01005 [Rhodovulum sp. BSW8]|uniref:Uncharacterized protein n=3 Tax=Rhodovulum TaxID=34008 RepID=A0A4R8FS41_9RHOB|nr:MULTISPECIES: hypothetical protein [Rhodovulum]OLS44153.1 hypothetical protein BV509_07280 [Rhodovulum sulfidophilum]MBL3571761.1 hypothetical protein [Rhodovulum visakhapatnamense]MBL3580182.1 hypothetical protein [Rhodovulum visakhapatnamense]PTW50868.1 hypothetical protein C8N38_103103 [Rhodovulum kholense]RAP41981.1 hypothetical protein BYZ73_06385 [Rhodovulum viride]
MAFEQLKAGIALILEEIEKRPEDRHVLQEELRGKIAEMHALGLPVPEDILRLEQELEDDDSDDLYDDMPV